MKQNIILLFGGESDERLVSTASAQAMAEALTEAKIWFWSKNNSIYLVDYKYLISHEKPFTHEFIPQKTPIFASLEHALASPEAQAHILVLALHGGKGENGYVQALCEQHKIIFTGSDAKSSKLAFDKLDTKAILRNFNINLAPELIINPRFALRELQEFLAEHGEIIIKPVCGGSSLGCSFVKKPEDLEALAQIISEAPDKSYFAEKIIHGRELSVGVLEESKISAPLGLCGTEIISAGDFIYESKYLGLNTQEITPADLNEKISHEAKRLAVAAHVALKLDGYSRTDMILSGDKLYYLETNTLPGLTKKSIFPQQLAAMPMTLREFLMGQVKLAMHDFNPN